MQQAGRLWRGFRAVMERVGNFQARVILTLMYAIIMLPFGVMVRLFSDPLRIKKRPTEWLAHPDEAMDMAWAKRQ